MPRRASGPPSWTYRRLTSLSRKPKLRNGFNGHHDSCELSSEDIISIVIIATVITYADAVYDSITTIKEKVMPEIVHIAQTK